MDLLVIWPFTLDLKGPTFSDSYYQLKDEVYDVSKYYFVETVTSEGSPIHTPVQINFTNKPFKILSSLNQSIAEWDKKPCNLY